MGLHRVIGNQAMGQLLQRKGKPHGKEAQKPKYKPYELEDEMAMDWPFERIYGWAQDRYTEKNFREAAAAYEAAYWHQPRRDIAWTISVCFRQLKEKGVEGADEMYKYWGEVANGARKPTPPPWLQHA
jgi:hypothetical protein